jgi:D-alanyl-D-alanine carboxypeptidase (penicillin-binding protein 5/6)
MNSRKILFPVLILLIVALVLPSEVLARRRIRRGVAGVSARSAILSNISQGKRYYGKNVHARVVPASTTKVMTALLVLEKLPLDSVVTVSSRADNVAPTKAGLRPGEKYLVRDLLYALLLSSSNDASVALAEAVGGTEQNFVAMMNSRARQLGAYHTHFVNSHGLPSRARQYTSAYDMMMMFRAAMKYEFFREAITLKYKMIASTAGRTIALKSHNKILFSDWKNKIYGKTGYTRAAQTCFVGYVPKGNDTVIVAVFGCKRRWTDIRYIVSRYGGIGL